MKKLFYLAAAAMTIVSCAKQEVVDVPKNAAIGFDTFVGKNTRADVTTANLETFYVYGQYSADGGSSVVKPFDGETVSKSGSDWTYSPLRYWVADAVYKFAASAPKADASFDYNSNKLTISDYTVADDNADLIVAAYATAGVTGKASSNDEVQFAFVHALSKVLFTFTSEWESEVEVTVSDIALSGVINKGTAEVTMGTTATEVAWTGTDTGSYSYTDLSGFDFSEANPTEAKYLRPQTLGTVTLTFTVKVDALPEGDNEKTVTVTLPTETVGVWENGKVYNYTLTINAGNVFDLEPIKFGSITVSDWADEDNTPDLTPDQGVYPPAE